MEPGTIEPSARAERAEPPALSEPGAAAATDVETEPGPSASEAEEAAPEPRAGGPVIHVPGRELNDDEAADDGDSPTAPAKKRTRRGSRGGKNRRKKPAVAGEATATGTLEATGYRRLRWTRPSPPRRGPSRTVRLSPRIDHAPNLGPSRKRSPPRPEPEPEPEAASENGDGEWTYTPMSQWGDSN